jgi:hypothetical protein
MKFVVAANEMPQQLACIRKALWSFRGDWSRLDPG